MPGDWDTFTTVALWVCWGLFGLVWVIGAAYNALRAPAVRRRSAPAYGWLAAAAAPGSSSGPYPTQPGTR
jgi:hypothetical protein